MEGNKANPLPCLKKKMGKPLFHFIPLLLLAASWLSKPHGILSSVYRGLHLQSLRK